MVQLAKDKFVCVDCETTGLDVESDRIIEVGVTRFTFESVEETFESLINPEREISPESRLIHKISDEMVADKPTIDQVLPEVLKLLKGATLIGHGIFFDIQMLAKAAGRIPIPCDLMSRPYIDTVRLARLYGESPRNSLEALRKHFQIPAATAHRALDDATTNAAVFKRLVERYRTTEEVFNVLSRPIRLKEMPLGKHKGRPFTEVPAAYLRWAARQKFDQDLLYSIRSELKKRGTGNQFRQAGNPFQQL